MVFSKFAEILSAAASRFSAPKSSTLPYVSSGLSPPPNPGRSYGLVNSEQHNNFRFSYSLQDFSTYSRRDPEGGDLNSWINGSLIHSNQFNFLPRGNVSSFSKEKALPGSPLAPKKWGRVIIVLLCLLLFAVLIFTLQFYYSKWSQGTPKFYVVLDCGSTGTRVYVYQANVNYKKDGSLPILSRLLPESIERKTSSRSGRAYNRMETEPGFDKLVHNISGLKRAIKPLIQWAEKKIPGHTHKTTSLFFYATAGVRRLPSSHSQWLLNNAWSILKNSPFVCQREWVKIISGMEEAYYGWIALNYHTGMLGAIPQKSTFGALDLGGSSLQVTFESKEQVHNETSLKLSIGPVNHHLSAYSLSGYGLNDAFDKSVVHLLKRVPEINSANLASGNIQINHPCLQSGYKEQYFCSQCVSIHQEGSSPLSGGEILDKGRKPRIPIQLIGSPKWEECRELAKVAVNVSEWSDLSPGIDWDARVKMPLSPTVADAQQRPFGTGIGFSDSSVQLTDSSLFPSTSSVSHSYSSGSLGQMQFDNSSMASVWTPHRSQMRLQSRRSQSREDLNSSMAEAHLAKV